MTDWWAWLIVVAMWIVLIVAIVGAATMHSAAIRRQIEMEDKARGERAA